MTFGEWITAVDMKINNACGLTTGDLADQPYRDWYNDDIPPGEAAQRVLEDEGFPFDIDEDGNIH